MEPTTHGLSTINDPFTVEGVGNIVIGRVKTGVTDYWFAMVFFESGHTTGQQRTPNCDSFEDVIAQLKMILDSVKNR